MKKYTEHLTCSVFSSSPHSVHSGRCKPEGLLCVCPERPKGPRVWLVRPSPRRDHSQGLPVQLSQHHPAQRLPHPGSCAPAVSQLPSTLPGLPCAGKEACGRLPYSCGFRGAHHSGPHHLLHSQETQGVLLMVVSVGFVLSFYKEQKLSLLFSSVEFMSTFKSSTSFDVILNEL